MKLQRCSRNQNENLRKLNVIECNLGGCYMLVSVYYVGLLMCVGFTRLSSFNVECQGHALSMWSVRCYLDTQNTCTISNVKCQVLLFGHTNTTPYFTRLSSFNVECRVTCFRCEVSGVTWTHKTLTRLQMWSVSCPAFAMWSVKCYCLDTQPRHPISHRINYNNTLQYNLFSIRDERK
jgi:hypothetical protein